MEKIPDYTDIGQGHRCCHKIVPQITQHHHTLQFFYAPLLAIFTVAWFLALCQVFRQRNSFEFSSPTFLVLFFSGITNGLVTVFQFLIILLVEPPCLVVKLASFLTISILHFPYMLRGLQLLGLMGSFVVKKHIGKLIKSSRMFIAITIHATIALLYCCLSWFLDPVHSPRSCCSFNIPDAVFMLFHVVTFVFFGIFSCMKVGDFRDSFGISSELKAFSVTWVVLACPYLAFQSFLKDSWIAANIMIVMNFILLYFSFFRPLGVSRASEYKQLKVRHRSMNNSQAALVVTNRALSSKVAHFSDMGNQKRDDQGELKLTEKDRSNGPQAFKEHTEDRLYKALKMKMSFDKIMKDKDLEQEMLLCCKQCLCEENPMFLTQVISYKELMSSDCKSMRGLFSFSGFADIYNKHISSQGSLTVNVSWGVYHQLEILYNNNNPAKFLELPLSERLEVFDKAYREIEDMLYQNLKQALMRKINNHSSPVNQKRSRGSICENPV